MREKNILLLGGGGFIGTALARRLCENNFNVHILSKHFPAREIEPNMIFYQGNLDDKKILERVLPECKTVIHLASSTTPGSSSRQPALEADKNITPTLRFLDILQGYENVHIIFVSSGGTLYGNPESPPVNETHPLNPLSFHGAGKVALETFLRTFSTLPEKNTTIVRPSNVYGPGQSLRSGFGVMRTMLEHVRRGTVMEIWGDGMSVRDFLYIDDMLSALICLIDFPYDNNTYNVGSGIGYSLNQLKKIIESVCGKKLAAVYRPSRRSDVKTIVLDSYLLSKKTKWHPTVSLEQGIELTWKWLKKQ
ncbi:MAG: NAD-dependent epimerase/dehydratase family protein [Methanosarcinaceae archaeon]|nr:NAD-dependent epimerase/dehydratase family protein [Methanosarcinaceae archaeon]